MNEINAGKEKNGKEIAENPDKIINCSLLYLSLSLTVCLPISFYFSFLRMYKFITI